MALPSSMDTVGRVLAVTLQLIRLAMKAELSRNGPKTKMHTIYSVF